MRKTVNVRARVIIIRSRTHINRLLRPIRVLNGGIVALNPLIMDELGYVLFTTSSAELKGGAFPDVWGLRERQNAPVRQLFPTPPLLDS